MGTNEKRRRALYRESIILVIGLFVIGAGLYSYFSTSTEAALLRAAFVNGSVQTATLKLKVVESEVDRRKGLMYERQMPLDRGMLFVFKTDAVQSFWMKDTLIPLDMIFLDKDMKVVGMLENVPVLNTEPRRVESPSRYVLEVNGGVGSKLGVKTGSVLKILAGSLSGYH